ncbi:MAG TPA: glycosyltransferase family 2 protein [Vitreimonas sp.]|uniref:glycosyltransferase family 2 protein n=1 Tax=Vitreimonas sp. TaxID=3069702 RepID=UPI002D63EB0E|nr:glycosyltransferase family 2 protein [Vitreimonas sp.]HYD86250.1 glycosyltransferase family 2 protein [Vitreimonas sp.]
MTSVAVLIPAWNEQKTIGRVVKEAVGLHTRVYVVDDGSEDATSEIAAQNGASVISCSEHVGFGRALTVGIRELMRRGYDVVGTMDADGAHDPADLVGLFRHQAITKAGLVLGSRFCDPDKLHLVPSAKRAANAFAVAAFNLISSSSLSDVATGMRVLSREALEQCPEDPSFQWAFELIANCKLSGVSIAEHPIRVRYDSSELLCTTQHEMVEFLRFCIGAAQGRTEAACIRLEEYIRAGAAVAAVAGGRTFIMHFLSEHTSYLVQEQDPWFGLDGVQVPIVRLDW